MSRKTSLILSLAALFAVGCDSDDDGINDGDDCAPTNADIHPDAEEICDGIDNNCDGVIDEGVTTTFWADADSDGWGGSTLSVDACEAPAGFVEDSTDCNDASADAYPDAPEVCDDIDNNCDGAVDDDDPTVDLSTAGTYYGDSDSDGYGSPDASVQSCSTPDGHVDNADDCDDDDPSLNPETPWYSDLDADGWGSEIYVTNQCEAPEGYVRAAGDCDDFEAATNPDADEYCDDIDNNCDGTIDEATAVDAPIWYEDNDEDGWGSTVAVVECYQPSGHVSVEGDCDDTEATVNPDASEICGDNLDNDCDSTVDFSSSVPTDYATIQDAIDTVADGDGFCVEAGTYYENLYIDSKSVTISGYGEGSTILDGSGSNLIYAYYGGVTLRHMTLQNAYDRYGGVYEGYESDGSFQNVTLEDVGCSSSSSCYGGAFSTEYGTLALREVTADAAMDVDAGSSVYGGFLNAYDTEVTVDGLDFTNNYVGNGSYSYAYGWLAYIYDGSFEGSDIDVSDNWFYSRYYTYGLLYVSGSDVSFSDTSFDDNILDNIDYVYGDNSYSLLYQAGSSTETSFSNVTWQGNEIWSNDDNWAWFYFSSPNGSSTWENVLIANNSSYVTGVSSSNGAYGLMYTYYTEVSLTNVDVSGNTWDGYDYLYGVLGYRSYQGDIHLLNTNVVNNSELVDTTYAGVLYTSYGNDQGYGTFEANYSNFYGNWEDWSNGYDWYDNGSDGDLTQFDGNISADPLYTDQANGDFTLGAGSPAIDAGSPELLDTDGTTSDIGAHGGPNANL